MMDSNKPADRFDRLLKAMTEGEAPSAGTKTSARQASSEERDADCGETQTPPDTSEGA